VSIAIDCGNGFEIETTSNSLLSGSVSVILQAMRAPPSAPTPYGAPYPGEAGSALPSLVAVGGASRG
jgi:hypothetical protein